MPTYSYRCTKCNNEFDKIRPMDDRRLPLDCPECGEKSEFYITAPMVQAYILGGGDKPGYECPVTGEFVTSRKRRKEIMAEHNLVEKESARPK